MGEPEIETMSVPESALRLWASSCAVDTKGLCNCGHEGLGVSWHTNSCPGAVAALDFKLFELFHELYTQWERAHRDECRAVDPDTGLCPSEAGEDDECRWPLPSSLT